MEQRIKVIKSTAGYTDVVNNDDKRFFKSLELALPEIQEFLSAGEGDAPTRKHNENKDTFSEHVAKVSKGILTNPFPDAVSCDSENLLGLGEQQYMDFKLLRFILCQEDVDSTITKDAPNLPSTANKVRLQLLRVKLG